LSVKNKNKDIGTILNVEYKNTCFYNWGNVPLHNMGYTNK